MYEQIYKHLWMHLPREERLVIAEAFDLPRTGVSEIRDSDVVSDGHSDEDLAHLTREAMAEWVGEPADTAVSFPRLWELTCAKAHSIVNPPIAVMESKDGVINLADLKEVSNEEFGKLPVRSKPSKNAKSKTA